MADRQRALAVRALTTRRAWAALLAALFSVSPLAAWASPLEDAASLAERGSLAEALAILDGVRGADAPAARVLRGRVLARMCRLPEALEVLEAEAGGAQASPDARAALGEILVDLGRPADAIPVLDPAVEQATPPSPAARYWRAVAFDRTGRRSRAQLELEDFARSAARAPPQTPEEALYTALAWRGLHRFVDANDAFRAGVDTYPEAAELRLAWARLFLEKYRPDEADELIKEVLALAPDHPDALALAARTALELSNDSRTARDAAGRALRACPTHPDALDVAIAIAIDDQEYEHALDLAARGLSVRPRRVELLAHQGAVHYLRADMEAFDRTASVLDQDTSAAASFYSRVGEAASRSFRYAEGLALQQRALELDGAYGPALVAMGLGYSRLGDDQRALGFLRRAFDADPFNVQAYTMVELWEGALNEYRYVDDPEIAGLRFRFHRDEQLVLSRYVPDAIRAAWRRYEARYQASPNLPVSIEVFRDAETFSIRSVGVPWAMQSGICFGHVVTARSPSGETFNWRQTLEHELSHVFSMTVSASRVPRWFTEGLAEYDTILSDDAWRRDDDLTIVRALQENRLIGVMALNRAFTDFERPEQVLDAYFQASVVVEFIGTRWGYPALVEMLKAWAESASTPAVIERALGLSVDAFDDAFEEAMRARYAPMLALVDPTTWTFDVERERTRAGANPNDPSAHARLAWALLGDGDPTAALQAAQTAQALDRRDPLVNLFLAEVAASQGRAADARTAAEAVLAAGAESITARTLAAAGAIEAQDYAAARAHLEAAITVNPRNPVALRSLVDVCHALGDDEAATRARVALARADEHDFDAAVTLLRTLAPSDPTSAVEFGLLATNIQPFDVGLHADLGRAAHAIGAWRLAERELELAVALDPHRAREAYGLLADVYEALGMPAQADDARRRAE